MNCPHCGIHIDEHEAGRCLDAWVIEKAMNWWGISEEDGWFGWNYENEMEVYDWIPRVSTSISAAWEVVKKLNRSGYMVEIINDCVAWSVVFRNIDTGKNFTSDWRASLETQICRAAIKATLLDNSSDNV